MATEANKLTGESARHDSLASLAGRVPITIAVTGHRNPDPAILETLRSELDNVLGRIRRANPHTPMVLLTPLAQGADQLTAGVALDAGIAVHAVLPMDIDEYRRDFVSNPALQEFEYYLRQSSSVIELPATDTEAGRSACYAEVGKWIVDECDILIALWDGSFNDLAGGTGEIVRYALSGEMSGLDHEGIASAPDIRGVWHLHTAREGDTNATPASCRWRVLKDVDELLAEDGQLRPGDDTPIPEFRRVEEFNELIARVDEPGYSLLDDDTLANCPPQLSYLHELYRKADLTANRFQTKFVRHTRLFYTLTAVSLLSLMLYFRVLPLKQVIAFYVVAYLATVIVSVRLRRSGCQKSYHFYRLVGEMGRLFFFAELLDSCKRFRGSALDGTRETQFLRRKLGDDASWLIAALRKRRLWDAGVGTFETPEGAVRLAREHWVKDQLQYFDRASKRDGQRTSRLDAIGTVLFAVSLLAGLGLSLTSFLDVDFSSTAVDVMSAVIGTSAGIGGVIKTYAHTMGYRELSGQYRQMEELYGNAYAQLETTPGNAADVFEQLWWEAVMENVEWYSLKTSRPVKAIGFKGLSRNFKSWAKLAQP